MKHYKMSLCLLTWNVINQKSCFLHFNQFSRKTWKLAPARTNERLMKKVLHIWMKVKKSYLLHLLFCEEICIIFQFISMMKYFSWGVRKWNHIQIVEIEQSKCDEIFVCSKHLKAHEIYWTYKYALKQYNKACKIWTNQRGSFSFNRFDDIIIIHFGTPYFFR